MTPSEFKKKRLELGLTQPKFAKLIQMSLRQVCRWESGDWPVPKVVELAFRELIREREEVNQKD